VDEFLLRVFQGEVLNQCHYALRGAALLDEWRRDVAEEHENMRRYFKLEQEIRAERVAAGNRGDVDGVSELWKRQRAVAKKRQPVREPTVAAWFAIQSILVSASNISKLLWGSPSHRRAQADIEADRQALRLSLRATKKSPLRSRAVRNGFEHIDEELERLGKPGAPKVYVSRNIGRVRAIKVAQASAREWYGHYDPETGRVTFLGRRSASIPRLIGEVERIYPIVEELVRQPF